MTRIPMCGGGAENDAGGAAEEAVEAEVTAVAVEEEESTMGTHEIDKHVSCLIIKPDIIEQVFSLKLKIILNFKKDRDCCRNH